jgi:hypothetical protein
MVKLDTTLANFLANGGGEVNFKTIIATNMAVAENLVEISYMRDNADEKLVIDFNVKSDGSVLLGDMKTKLLDVVLLEAIVGFPVLEKSA